MLNPFQEDSFIPKVYVPELDLSSWAYWRALAIPNAIWTSADYCRWTYNENDILTVTYVEAVGSNYWIWSVNIQTGVQVYITGADPQPIYIYDLDSAGHQLRALALGKSSNRSACMSRNGKYLVFLDSLRRRFVIVKDGIRIQTYDLGVGINCENISISQDGKYIFYNIDVNNIHILRGS